ncbi:RNA helicase required for poly(A+) mRNA export, partial [Physocladia obscura]
MSDADEDENTATSWGDTPDPTVTQTPTQGQVKQTAAATGWGAPPAVTDLSLRGGWGAAAAPSAPSAPSSAPPRATGGADVDALAARVGAVAVAVAVAGAVDAAAGVAGAAGAAGAAAKHTRLIDTDGGAEDGGVRVTLGDAAADATLYQGDGATSFEDLGLGAPLLRGIYGMGFERPSRIQQRALPVLLADPPRNMVGQSQSGTGKTAAFVLTMLKRIDYASTAVQALCLAPSRELARQIMDVVREMGKFTAVTTAFAIKDVDIPRGVKLDAQLVVGTPGTVVEFAKKGILNFSHCKIFVLDEADNMLDFQGLGDQSIRIRKLMPKTCQILLFSATWSDDLRNFASRVAPNAATISLKHEEL